MLSNALEKEGRVSVSWVQEYIEGLDRHKAQHARRALGDRDIVLHGFVQGSYTFPYPGPYGQRGPVVKLWRGQAAHLVVELLKKMAPDGELPQGSAELLDFVSEVIRLGSNS
ncbi:hypothetical protein AB0G86_18615 [Streptomyces scabiei]|uniref:hypothetical protein n=1 Tax=Streptomyces scabiei TaxID=1930 RepID=UPI0033E7659C